MKRTTNESRIQQYVNKSVGWIGELKEGLEINKNDLDTDLSHQPSLYHKVSEQYAQAVSQRDSIKYERDKLVAELDRAVRNEAKINDEKISETQVANRIKEDPTYDKTYRDYLLLCYLCDLWKALEQSYEERNFALSKVADLYISGYFSTGSGGKERIDAVGRKAEYVRNRQEEMRNSEGRPSRERI
jgi:hypothetical protein